MTIPILKITDGTTEISLIQEGGNAFYLESWRPAVAQFKGGGTFQQSSMSGGRQLVDYQYKNVIESFNLKIADVDPDSLIRQTQELRRLLIKAVDYWTQDFQDEPVWIEARAANETNTRYAIIHSYSAPDDENPFSQPFLQDRNSAVMDAWTLSIERGHWMDNDPTDSSCVEASGLQEEPYRSWAFVPTASTDDADVDHNAGTIALAGTSFSFGHNAPGQTHDLGVRFRNVAIPQGVTILSAFVRFTATSNQAGATVNSDIRGEDTATSAAFSTYANFTGRTRTSALVAWDAVAAWTIGTTYDTPDIATIVQEIVDLTAWASGNDMTIFVEDDGSSPAALRVAASWDNVTYNEPELHIVWAAPPAYGRAATCTDEIFVANKQNLRNLTHIFVDDGGVFGANLLQDDPPYALLPAVPAANDAIYFGIEAIAGEEFIFASLIFDIGAAGSGYTQIWEHSRGGGLWIGLVGEVDTTAPAIDEAFGNTGVNNVSWEPEDQAAATWDVDTVNGVTAFWIRCRVITTPGPFTQPTQQNRHVYTVTWPYIEIGEDGVGGGDILALGRSVIVNRFLMGGTNATMDFLAMGLRSLDRGSNFQSHLNLSDQQQPDNITATHVTEATIQNTLHAPTGRAVYYFPVSIDTWVNTARITIDATLTPEFYGIYHVYLRVMQGAGSVGQIQTFIQFSYGEIVSVPNLYPFFSTEIKTPAATGEIVILDFSEISLPGGKVTSSDIGHTLRIEIFSNSTVAGATANMELIDLILLPVDEWAADFLTPNLSGFVGVRNLDNLEVDSLTEKWMIRALGREYTTNYVTSPYRDKANGPMILVPRKEQRIYFLSGTLYPTDTTSIMAQQGNLLSAQVFQNGRYLSMRGDR